MKEVLKTAFRRTISKKFFNWTTGSVGSLLGILLIGKNFFSLDPLVSLKYGAAAYTGIYLLRFIFFFTWETLRHFYKQFEYRTYGEAILFLKEAFSICHWVRIRGKAGASPAVKKRDLKASMVYMCNHLKKLYDKKAKGDCTVMIKLLLDDNEGIRTIFSNDGCDQRIEKEGKVFDSMFSDTRFSWIVAKLTDNDDQNNYYFHNRVKSNKDYTTSSKDNDGVILYESEIVVPIIPLYNNKDKRLSLVGFLCIDCNKAGVFNERYDVGLLQGVADGIYDLILDNR